MTLKETNVEELPFEEAIAKLEKIVSMLEDGDVPLEQALDLFQQGMQLSNLCGKKLEQVEKKIEALIEEDGALVKKPFSGAIEDQGDLL